MCKHSQGWSAFHFAVRFLICCIADHVCYNISKEGLDMIVYQATKGEFLNDVTLNLLSDKILKKFRDNNISG
jgi:hypothetical protein